MDAMTAGDQTFFKAVQTDGTDFRTGAVDYAALCGTGQTLPLLPGGPCCGPGVYHASTEAAETLIGGAWPCRLFRVTGVPVSSGGSKRGFRTLEVLEELPAHLALGPNGEEVAELISKAGRLTADQTGRLSTAWNAAWNDAWNAARPAARFAARSAAGSAARSAAWNAAWSAAWEAAREAAWSAWAADREPAWEPAWYAAGNAAEALMVKDLIAPEQFDVLYGPWASVMETGSGS